MEQIKQCLACNSTNYQPFVQAHAMLHLHLPNKHNFDRCYDFGLVFLNPRVPETALGQFYTSPYLPYRVD